MYFWIRGLDRGSLKIRFVTNKRGVYNINLNELTVIWFLVLKNIKKI